MATPKKQKNGKWRAQIYIGEVDGKQKFKSITCDTKAECEWQIAKFKNEGRPKPQGTVREAIEEYISLSQVLSPTTLSAYNKILAYAFPSIMDLPIESLDTAICQNAINLEMKRTTERTGKPLSPKTVKNEWGLVASALKLKGKSFNVRLPKQIKKSPELPPPQVVIDAIKGDDIELPCLLAMWCSLRMSEVKGLQYKHVRNGFLYVEQALVNVDGEEILKPYPKTEASIRRIKLPDTLLEMIGDGNPDDFIVPMSSVTIRNRFKRYMLARGYDFSYHGLRHLFATIMLSELNVPKKYVEKMGGWQSSSAVLERVYSNIFTDTEEKISALRDGYYDSMIKGK